MLNWITHLMNSMGYAAIVGLMFLENVFPPIPSELIMPLAGFTAAKGKLSLLGVIVAGTLGSVLGALPLYYLGKIVGQERLVAWADKHGKWLALSGRDISKSKDWFDKHGHKAVLVCRLVPGVRSLISIPAGIAEMPLPQFLIYSALGAGLWTAILAFAGFKLGENYARVEKYLGPAAYVVLGAIAVAYVVRVVKQNKAGATER